MAKSTLKQVKDEYVYIRRVNRPTRLSKDITNQSRSTLSVFVKKDRVVQPIDYMSELGMDIYANVLGMSTQDVSYPKAVNNYLIDTSWRIPPEEGLKLNITTVSITSGGKKIDKPVAPTDYLAYLVALTHIKENSGYFTESENGSGSKKAMYYLHYPEKEKQQQVNILEEETEATYLMSTLFKNSEWDKINWILSYFGILPYRMDDGDKKLKMHEIITGKVPFDREIKSAKGKVSYKEHPAKFFELICTDKDIEMKSVVETLIKAGIVNVVGSRYFMGEEELGNTMEGVILNLKEETPDNLALRRRVDARFEVVKKEHIGTK